MTRITSNRDEIIFCSDTYSFYAYKNQEKQIELLLYKYYQKDGNNWILLSRKGEVLSTYIYSLSSDFAPKVSNGTEIKGAFDDATLHLLYFLMIINGLEVMTAIDEESKVVYSFLSPLYDDCSLKGTKSIEVKIVRETCSIESDWTIKKASKISIDEMRENIMFPSRLLDRFIPSSIALSIIKFGLFDEQSTFWFSNTLSPLDTFSSLLLAIHYSLTDHLIKVIIRNGGLLTIIRDKDIFFFDDIFSVLKKEGVTEPKMCIEVRNIISKALSLGMTMTNDEWRDLITTIMFHSDKHPRESYMELFRFMLSIIPAEIVSPTDDNESLLNIANTFLDKEEWEDLFEEMEEIEEYIEAYRENTNL